jgi:membrane protease YdiL (CAAX protease family)
MSWPDKPIDRDSSADDPGDPLAPLGQTTDPQLGNPSAANSPAESSASTPLDAMDRAILSYNSSPNAEPSGSGAEYPHIAPSEPQASSGLPRRLLDPDLRVPWGWLDILLLVFVFLGASVLSAIFLAIFFASRGIPFTAIQHSRYLGFFVIANELIIYVALFLYLWLQARARFNVPFWSTFGWRRLEPDRWSRPLTYLGLIALGGALSLSVQLVSAAFPPKTKLPIEALMQNREAALAIMAMSVILAPLVEETIFRGFLYPVAARSFGIPAGIIFTGTVFGLMHAQQLWGGWAQIALLVVVGIVFTWVRAAKRTVLASYLLHISYNSLIVLFGLHSLRH